MRCPLCPMLDEHGICTEDEDGREAFWLAACPLDARRRKIEEIIYDEKKMYQTADAAWNRQAGS